VQVSYTLASGTKINLADVSQEYSDETYGFQLYVPSYFTAETKKDENGESIPGTDYYSYEALGMTVTATGSSLEENSDNLKTRYQARLAELKEQEADITQKSLDTKKNSYTIVWEKDDVITQETVFLGSKAENVLTISYPSDNKAPCSQIADYTTAAFQTGE
jgi:hypothetical protein